MKKLYKLTDSEKKKIKSDVRNESREKYEILRMEKRRLNKYTTGIKCNECEEFFKALNMSEEDIKDMVHDCSRHRVFDKKEANERRNRTPPGYWDLDFITDEDVK